MCEAEGKRLCDAHEWEGACAGKLEPPDYRFDLVAGHELAVFEGGLVFGEHFLRRLRRLVEPLAGLIAMAPARGDAAS